ncbi:MAG: amidohydrolase family protein, partial [Synergistaceae bacterium]|nr:amidohydrolase family protein [Synergistaceae bacterium]
TPITHRSPGPILAAADFNDLNQAVMAELICDGVHVHAAAIRNAFRLFNDNIIMISDSLRATGMPDGEYELGGQIFIKQGHKACLKTSPETLAGSVTNLMDCVRFAVKNNIINLEQAVKCAAVNPAMAINIYDKFGSIEPGKTANLVILNKNLETAKVFIRGKIL